MLESEKRHVETHESTKSDSYPKVMGKLENWGGVRYGYHYKL